MPKVPDNSIYLDYASTTPVHPEIVADAQTLLADYFYNADSLHYGGQRVADLVKQSRNTLASMLGVLPHELVFTSGASEANSAAIKGIAFANMGKGKHIITSTVEHSSSSGAVAQLESVFGFEISRVGVKADGAIDVDAVFKALRDDTILVCVLAVNNEVGAITDIPRLARGIKKRGSAYLHVDGVQALAHHEFDMQNVDSVAYSAHKIYGLKGSGLWIKRANVPCLPLINGGQQQYGLRGGTIDNVAAILWAKTLRLARELNRKHKDTIQARSQQLYDAFINEPRVIINSTPKGVPTIFNISIPHVGSEIMMNGLNRKKIAVSAQSTCNSQSLAPSHVLMAMGRSTQEALSTIRISLSYQTTEQEINTVIHEIMEVLNYVTHQL